MFKTLASVKLAIVLLVLIIVASIIGTLIPQNWNSEQYIGKYGDTRYRLLSFLQLTDVYHSLWYSFLLLVLCVNLCACSLQNLRPLMHSLRKSSLNAGRFELSEMPVYEKISLGDVNIDSGAIKSVLTRSLYRLKYTNPDNGIYYFERGKLGRLGPLITHASIIVILVGGIFVSRLGSSEHVKISVGSTIDAPYSDFQIRVDDFRIEVYPNSHSPKEYTSVVTVIEDGSEKFTKLVEVNYPLKHKGVKFYQSDYGLIDIIEVELSSNSPDSAGEIMGQYEVNTHEVFRIPDSQFSIKVLALLPDFVMDDFGNVGTRSNHPNNPAALLELYEGNERKFVGWSFPKFPDFHGSGESDYSLKLISIKHDSKSKRYYTVLQISHDPGLPAIWAGFLFMILGMFLSFYMQFKRLWIKVSDDGVEIGGRSYKNRANFDREVKHLRKIFS